MPVPRVLVVIATYRRPIELAALIESLAGQGGALAGALIVDNGAASETSVLAARAPVPTRVITPRKNLGCGGGVALGLDEALRDTAATHVWLLDDDARATPGALDALLAAMDEARADAAVPLVADAAGRIGWFPGPLAQPAWDVIRTKGMTPAVFRAACGLSPLAWTWAPWPSLLVTRHAVETVGLPRDDYWFQGEDLEWTLRLSARFGCVLAPAAECRHLPPAAENREREFLKSALMLQNNFFTASRLPHGRRLQKHAPGNVVRFLRREQWAPRAVVAVWLAFWRGMVKGGPAGRQGCDGFRAAWDRKMGI